jgi:hypothetical protein
MSREFGRDDYDSGNRGTFTPNLVGVAMPFKGDEWDGIYSVIKDECKKAGLRSQRVDEYVRSGVVIRDIAELIENAEFLIFDLSRERQNVYYELGYAHGVGNEAGDILLIAQEGTQLHYDIAGLRVHFYESLDRLRQLLARTLSEMVRASRR